MISNNVEFHKINFIEHCTKKYNEQYDYSEINYINDKTNITFKCKKCNTFITTSPKIHKKQCKCKGCIKDWTKSKKDFIKQVMNKHKNKYDYSKVEYNGNLIPVIVICKTHGEFLITPKIHKTGSGCKFCNQGIRTKEELLIDFNIKHNNKYTYNLSNYKTTSSKIQIFCPEYSHFEQQVNKHLDGHGCRLCGNKKISEIKKKDINKLINEFNEIHNNKYDYSKINFVNYRTKVIITCKEHGDFSILPINHKNGSDCPKCNTKYKSLNLKQIVFKFKDLYGNKFKYPKLSKLYKNKQSKIIVKCPIHGEREQTVMLHCSCGCRICSQNQNQDDLINDFKFIH